MPSMIAIVRSIYSQSVHAPASHAGLMDNEAKRYCINFRLKGFPVADFHHAHGDGYTELH